MGPPTTISEWMAGRAHKRDPLHRLSSQDSDTQYEKCFYCKSKYQAHTCKTTAEVEPGCFPSPGCLRAGAAPVRKPSPVLLPRSRPRSRPRGRQGSGRTDRAPGALPGTGVCPRPRRKEGGAAVTSEAVVSASPALTHTSLQHPCGLRAGQRLQRGPAGSTATKAPRARRGFISHVVSHRL